MPVCHSTHLTTMLIGAPSARISFLMWDLLTIKPAPARTLHARSKTHTHAHAAHGMAKESIPPPGPAQRHPMRSSFMPQVLKLGTTETGYGNIVHGFLLPIKSASGTIFGKTHNDLVIIALAPRIL